MTTQTPAEIALDLLAEASRAMENNANGIYFATTRECAEAWLRRYRAVAAELATTED